ncbi:MAG TPA: DUF4350 domain-containing protein [Gaiellaceae bacterium]|nr:DUF4350 domain-containing protein [Gaiellaceae bacterium]
MSRAGWRAVAVVAAGVVLWNVVALAVDRVTGAPSGPPSSSYATSTEGLAAYAELLEQAGHPVSRLREPPAEADLGRRSVVVLLDPASAADEDVAALRRFVETGGTVVAGGAAPGAWLRSLLDDPPRWSAAAPARVRPLAPAPELAGVGSVEAAGGGSWRGTGEALPVLGDGAASLAAVATPGGGRIVLLADASPLQNRLLDEADNAAFGLALAAPADRPVVFVESVHGYEAATGLAAVPTRWRWALGGLVAAALLFMLARGRRLGPPEPPTRPLPPPRRDYVESLAATLAKTKRPAEATAPLRGLVRRRLERASAGRAADLEAIARRLGLRDDEIRAVLAPAEGGTDIMALGRALARLEGGPGATRRGGRE